MWSNEHGGISYQMWARLPVPTPYILPGKMKALTQNSLANGFPLVIHTRPPLAAKLANLYVL